MTLNYTATRKSSKKGRYNISKYEEIVTCGDNISSVDAEGSVNSQSRLAAHRLGPQHHYLRSVELRTHVHVHVQDWLDLGAEEIHSWQSASELRGTQSGDLLC